MNSIGYGGVHNNFIEALDWLGEENKADNFLSRLSAFPYQCEQYKELLQLGIEKNCVASSCMLRKVPEQLENLLSSLDNNSSAVCNLISSIVTSDSSLESQFLTKKNSFRDAIADLLHFFQTVYIPKARTESGCCGMKNGKEVYAHCLKFHTTTDMTAQEIQRYQVCYIVCALSMATSF